MDCDTFIFTSFKQQLLPPSLGSIPGPGMLQFSCKNLALNIRDYIWQDHKISRPSGAVVHCLQMSMSSTTLICLFVWRFLTRSDFLLQTAGSSAVPERWTSTEVPWWSTPSRNARTHASRNAGSAARNAGTTAWHERTTAPAHVREAALRYGLRTAWPTSRERSSQNATPEHVNAPTSPGRSWSWPATWNATTGN